MQANSVDRIRRCIDVTVLGAFTLWLGFWGFILGLIVLEVVVYPFLPSTVPADVVRDALSEEIWLNVPDIDRAVARMNGGEGGGGDLRRVLDLLVASGEAERDAPPPPNHRQPSDPERTFYRRLPRRWGAGKKRKKRIFNGIPIPT